jgi:pSer/pThr/pTyr-binding forkhead associated (FHA) protein
VHAVIAVEDGIYHIDDLGSTNGTFLNGNIVIRRRPLHDRDIIKVGDTKFAFTHEQRNSKSASEITSKLTHL